jgi:NAD(P)H dehydrogenase (quinone)
MSPSLALIYFSATGNTAQLANAIRIAASEHISVIEHRIVAADIIGGRFRNAEALNIVDSATAVVFGSPTFMGGPAAEFKAFADASSDRWSAQSWKDKLAAGFTTGTCSNGDQSHTLSYFTILASQHGMLWCGVDIPGGEDAEGRNRLGTQVGVVSQSSGSVVQEQDLLTAGYLGRRVALMARRLSSL